MLGGNVETVSNEDEIHSLKNNKIVGEPNIQNSNIPKVCVMAEYITSKVNLSEFRKLLN